MVAVILVVFMGVGLCGGDVAMVGVRDGGGDDGGGLGWWR